MIVIFPESPQTFTWGGSQNLLFIFRCFALFLASRGKVLKTKENGISRLRENGPHSSDEEILTSKPTFIQGVSEKLLKRGGGGGGNTNRLLSTYLDGV